MSIQTQPKIPAYLRKQCPPMSTIMASFHAMKELRTRPAATPVPFRSEPQASEQDVFPQKRLEIGRKPSNPFIEYMPEESTLSSHTIAMLAHYA